MLQSVRLVVWSLMASQDMDGLLCVKQGTVGLRRVGSTDRGHDRGLMGA